MISGKTCVVGIIANPIGHVRTPQVFNALMSSRQIDAVMLPMHVSATALELFMGGAKEIRNLAGLVVTIPHKEAILAYCSKLTSSAERVRAVNVVRFDRTSSEVVGTNTDGEGFVAGLKAQGFQIQGQSAYIAGAGGAAKAIADALVDEGASALGIYNRTESRASELVARLRAEHPGIDIHLAGDAPQGYALAINATSLGLQDSDPLPFRLDHLSPTATVAEVVMNTDVTPLLCVAQKHGNPIHFGRYMLDGQVERIARFLGLLT